MGPIAGRRWEGGLVPLSEHVTERDSLLRACDPTRFSSPSMQPKPPFATTGRTCRLCRLTSPLTSDLRFAAVAGTFPPVGPSVLGEPTMSDMPVAVRGLRPRKSVPPAERSGAPGGKVPAPLSGGGRGARSPLRACDPTRFSSPSMQPKPPFATTGRTCRLCRLTSPLTSDLRFAPAAT